MPKEKQKTDCGAQPLKYLSEDSVDDILANVDQFIEGVYRDLSLFSPNSATSKNSDRIQTRRSLDDSSSTNGSPVGATSLSVFSSDDENRNVSPSTRMNMDAEIERINRMCDTVDKNLRSVGVFMNNSSKSSRSEDSLNRNITSSPHPSTNFMSNLSLDSSPVCTTAPSNSETRRLSRTEPTVATIAAQIIDLSETQSPVLDNNNGDNGNDEDDVIIVSANINPVVDLCTPVGQKQRSRRRRLTIDHSDLSKRRSPVSEVQIVGTFDVEDRSTVRRRPTENKRKSLDISITEGENKNYSKSPSAGNTASGTVPYMCSVCMESCLQRQPTSTRCGHIFCNECVRKAINITRKCPLCNTRISRNHIFRIYP